jgi:hypothetical protein
MELDTVGLDNPILRYYPREEHVGNRYNITFRATAQAALINTETELSLTVVPGVKLVAGPNPFTDSLIIFLGTNDAVFKEISIYSVNGEKVWEKSSDTYNMESASVVWHGVNNSGAEVASGVYLVYVRTSDSEHKLKVFKKL